jgi:hypothetical protein
MHHYHLTYRLDTLVRSVVGMWRASHNGWNVAFLDGMMKSKGDKVMWCRWVKKKAKSMKAKPEPLILVVGQYRVVVLHKKAMGGITVCRCSVCVSWQW